MNFIAQKKNSINFFEEYLPASLDRIQIATDDRIIKFCFKDFYLYFLNRGKDTNVILMDKNGKISSFRKIVPDQKNLFLNEITPKLFTSHFNFPQINYENLSRDYLSSIRKNYPYISKDILIEISARLKGNDFKEFITHLSNVLDEIRTKNLVIYKNHDANKIVFSIASFVTNTGEEKKSFHNYQNALVYYIALKYSYEKMFNYKKNNPEDIGTTANKNIQ